MNPLDEVMRNFHRWEQRGRGTLTFSAPVLPAPPFVPFPGHPIPAPAGSETGRKHSLFSRLGEAFVNQFDTRSQQPPPTLALEQEPHWLGKEGTLIEFTVLLPELTSYAPEVIGQFLKSIWLAHHPIAFEIVGSAESIVMMLVASAEDQSLVASQLRAHFPEASIEVGNDTLNSLWLGAEDMERTVVDFGLAKEFMWPLATAQKADPFVGLMGSLENLQEGEVAIYQVVFFRLEDPWAQNAMLAVMRSDGKPHFEDGKPLVKATTEKVSRPLCGACVRLASQAKSLERSWEIVRSMAPTLRSFAGVSEQSLTPLRNEDYAQDAHCGDVAMRRSRRSGMILNLDELVGLVRLPTEAVRSEKFARAMEDNSRPAPAANAQTPDRGTVILGINEHDRRSTEVTLSTMQRLQHVHCIGGSGTGKSTLLLSMIRQDLAAGSGFALLDPHGDLLDRVLAEIPAHRLRDVVLIDPSDEQHITPFNVLSAHSDYEKTLLASDLVSVFRRLSTSWGDRMNIIFQNLVLAFLEHHEGGTLADMRRFLVDADWRGAYLKGVDDPDVQFYWQQTFPKLDGAKSVGPILTRLETLLTPKIIRYMVSQKENRIDFSEIMDKGRILLVRLPMGQIGKESAFMLGSLLMVKIQQMAMGRARLAEKDRRPFFCYVDECQHFVTPSMAEILAGARKYGLGLVLAHQDLHQLSQSGDVAAAVMTNAATRIVFRVSESDGRALKGDFAHYEPKDFAELPNLHAIARIGRADQDFNLRVIRPDDLNESEAKERRQAAIEASRSRYTVPRSEVEAASRRLMGTNPDIVEQKREQPTVRKTSDPELRTSETPASAQSFPSPAPSAVSAALIPDVPTAQKDVVSTHGKGGPEHQAKQTRLKFEAELLGFRAEKEFQVGAGLESVDVVLTRGDLRIACEVSVTTPMEHELANARKCLLEPFDVVALICDDAKRLTRMQIAIAQGFNEDERSRLQSVSLDDFLGFLKALPVPQSIAGETRIRGFKVKRKFVSLTAEERRAKTDEAFRLLCDEMRQPAPVP